MKSKIIQLRYIAASAMAIILLASAGSMMAQSSPPALNRKLQPLAMPQSTDKWIDFREGTLINPATVFTDLKEAFELQNEDEMKIDKTKKDKIGYTHYRYQQYHNNLKVVYGEYILHQRRDGFVKSANGLVVKGLKANNTAASATIKQARALEAALRFMNASRYLWQNPEMEKELKRQEKNENATYYPKGELVYAPYNVGIDLKASDYKLAWYFKIYTDDAKVTAKNVYVDAVTGRVIHYADIAMNCAGGSGGSAFNGNVSFSTELFSGSYRSHNDCQATNIYVYNCNGGGAVNTFYTDADNVWNSSQQSAVQAQWGALMTYNYYIGQHSRASWDNAAGNMIAYNNAYAGSNNACWGCTGNSAIFYAGSTAAATDDWNTDDIMGHEFTHGVTQAEANLTYSYESGALNESFSDIFGEMVESWAEGSCDYLVGADRGAIRSFINPNSISDYAGPMPDTYLGTGWYTGAADNGGVHHNSSVQNHWFYLLSEGGSGTTDFGVPYNVTGITRFKARLIAYRALTEYLTSSSKYIDARKATLQAALDLYGQCSPEIIAVGDAWHAVGVESQSSQFIKNVCGSYPASGTFLQSISELTAANGCSTEITPSTSTVYFAARDRIILYPGFRAASGSKFVAYLEPCSSTMYRPSSSDGNIIMSDAEKGIKKSVPTEAAPPIAGDISPAVKGISIYPNPFHSAFELSINSKENTKVLVYVYNSLGVKVKEITRNYLVRGSNKLSFNAADLASGVYTVEINMGDTKTVKKIVKL